MHYEILVEDQSGKALLDILVGKIIGPDHTVRFHFYKGIGPIPAICKPKTDSSKRILLDQLPRLLRGYGKTHANYSPSAPAAVIVVCDLDDRCLKEFRQELDAILAQCDPAPTTRFCLAIEEIEAWLLGDPEAILKAYPKAKKAVLSAYRYDSIVGTWEKLADAIHPGGSAELAKQKWYVTGAAKYRWATTIGPVMEVDHNHSPSFQYFRDKLRELAQ